MGQEPKATVYYGVDVHLGSGDDQPLLIKELIAKALPEEFPDFNPHEDDLEDFGEALEKFIKKTWPHESMEVIYPSGSFDDQRVCSLAIRHADTNWDGTIPVSLSAIPLSEAARFMEIVKELGIEQTPLWRLGAFYG